ncbi:MAG: SRPBCC family protein [Alphaproteobacteria bacterium]|nr:SRPBCC family protein [Alphaproteobacteria bacterium]
MHSILLLAGLSLSSPTLAQTPLPEPDADSDGGPVALPDADAPVTLPVPKIPDLPDGKVPDDWNGDIVATITLSAAPDAVTDWVSDLRNQQVVLRGCTDKWEHGTKHVGVGASAVLRYTAGPFKRKLTATISEVKPGRQVVVDHPGNKGFVTTWTATDVQGGTELELHTFLNLPPKPFRKVYVRKVQPVWGVCYDVALQGVAQRIGN